MSGYDGMSLAEKMLDALQKEGAEKASAQITKQIKSEMNIDSGKLSLYRTTENISFSLLSLIDGKKGVAAGNDTGESAIKETARQAAALSQSSEKDEANDISPQQPAAELAIGDEEPDNEKMYARLTEFLDYTKSAYPIRFLPIQTRLNFTSKQACIAFRLCSLQRTSTERAALTIAERRILT